MYPLIFLMYIPFIFYAVWNYFLTVFMDVFRKEKHFFSVNLLYNYIKYHHLWLYLPLNFYSMLSYYCICILYLCIHVCTIYMLCLTTENSSYLDFKTDLQLLKVPPAVASISKLHFTAYPNCRVIVDLHETTKAMNLKIKIHEKHLTRSLHKHSWVTLSFDMV